MHRHDVAIWIVLFIQQINNKNKSIQALINQKKKTIPMDE